MDVSGDLSVSWVRIHSGSFGNSIQQVTDTGSCSAGVTCNEQNIPGFDLKTRGAIAHIGPVVWGGGTVHSERGDQTEA